MKQGVIFDFNRTLYDPDTNLLVDGAINLLERLKAINVELCLISVKTREDRANQIEELGLAGFFSHIEIVEGEKQTENFEHCQQILNLQPDQIFVVGDRVEGEIRLGNLLGMKTVWFKSGKFADQLPKDTSEEPNLIITDLYQMFKIIVRFAVNWAFTNNFEVIKEYLPKGLIEVYRRAFGEPPWEESFSDQEIEDIFSQELSGEGSIIHLLTFDEKVIGLGIMNRLLAHPNAAKELSEVVDVETGSYIVDLAVSPEFRGCGLGELITDAQLSDLPENCTSVSLRTKEGSRSIPIYLRNDFSIVEGKKSFVQSKKLDGRIVQDEGFFMVKMINQGVIN